MKLQELKRDILAAYFLMRHPQTPFGLRALAFGVALYAFSPIDLIPDFIPVLGSLDDLLILPIGIALIVRLAPRSLLAECRSQADQWKAPAMPKLRSGAVLVFLVWCAILAAAFALLLR